MSLIGILPWFTSLNYQFFFGDFRYQDQRVMPPVGNFSENLRNEEPRPQTSLLKLQRALCLRHMRPEGGARPLL